MQAYHPARGDVQIKLPSGMVVLRPSFFAITLIEERFQRGIIDVARDYHNGKITKAKDFLSLLDAGMQGGGAPVPENLGDQMVEAGMAHLVEPLGQFLAHACGIKS